MSELKLLPCPFCGGEATIDNAGVKYQAWCKHCCCIHMGEFYNTEAEAIAAWNRRAQPENEPLTCEGCVDKGQYENEVEYGYPSPCTRCKRRSPDNYRRKPERSEG